MTKNNANDSCASELGPLMIYNRRYRSFIDLLIDLTKGFAFIL